jgi:hypothetical protein
MKRLILLLLFAMSVVSATTLTGSIKNPDGTGMTGNLFMSLSQQGSLQSTGGCSGPAEIVPTYQMRIAVVNGSLQSPPTIYGNDCMLPAGIYYNVKMTDTNGNVLMTDRWLITGSSIDIGTIVSVVVSGTTGTLGGAAVLTTPAGNQTVVQPPSSALSINNLTVTNDFIAPSGFSCTSIGCGFSSGVTFGGGIITQPGTNSNIQIGTGGNFYTRPFSGGDAGCAGIADGWFGVRTDAQFLETCAGGTMYRIGLSNANALLSFGGQVVLDNNYNLTVQGGTFGSAVNFNGGIVIPSGTNSTIDIGQFGNLFLRPISGADATCAANPDDLIVIRNDTATIEFCIAGNVWKVHATSN